MAAVPHIVTVYYVMLVNDLLERMPSHDVAQTASQNNFIL